jgi:membrane-associated protein
VVGSAYTARSDRDPDVPGRRWHRLDIDQNELLTSGSDLHRFVRRHVPKPTHHGRAETAKLPLFTSHELGNSQRTPVCWGVMTSTTLALMPSFMDPINLLGYFGTWALVGLLVVIFVESGVLFPILPGDSLLFVAGMLAAGTAAAARDGAPQANFQLWQLLVFIPIAAVLGSQVGYWIGRNVGTAMFKPDARVLKQKYLDEAHAFFEQRGPFAIVIARFVPIVRTLAPLTAGAARMSYAVFTIYNIIGAVVWGVGLTLLGYWLGQFEIIQKLLEPIFIVIVLASVSPMFVEWYKRRRAAKSAGGGAAEPATES